MQPTQQTIVFTVCLLLTVLSLFLCGRYLYQIRRMARRQIEKMSEETGEPHLCLPDAFTPITTIRSKNITLEGRTFPALVFRGIYCSGCGRELCCESCGKTPPPGQLIASYEEGERWSHCCEPPKWALRLAGKTLAPEERITSARKAEDPLRWN